MLSLSAQFIRKISEQQGEQMGTPRPAGGGAISWCKVSSMTCNAVWDKVLASKPYWGLYE